MSKLVLPPIIRSLKSDGHGECAVCATRMRKGQAYAQARLRLLAKGVDINVCATCADFIRLAVAP